MHLRPSLFIAACTLALVSCGNPAPQGSAAKAAGAAAAAGENPVKRQGGSWSMVHTTLAFDAENVTGGMADMVKAGQASIGRKDVGGPLCLSAEMAGKDDLSTRLSEAMHLGTGFRVIRSEVKDGKVDFAAVREDPAEGKSEVTITGTISATATDLTVTTDARQPAPGKGHIHTVMRQENTRLGDCTPGQDAVQ